MANERYEGVGLDGHYTLAEKIFTKIKSLFDTKVQTDVPANAVFTDEKVTQTESTSNENYEVLVSGTASTATTTEGVNKNKGFRYNPNLNTLMLGTMNNASTFGENAFAHGLDIGSVGNWSHAEGHWTTATGGFGAHAEGVRTLAEAMGSHAEGADSTAAGNESHAEGIGTLTDALAAHSEGDSTYANSVGAHSEGYYTTASGYYAHAEGTYNTAYGRGSHAEGCGTSVSGNIAYGQGAHAEGSDSYAFKDYSHAEGSKTYANGYYSHAEGSYTTASGNGSHVEGYGTSLKGSIASGQGAHAEGMYTKALSDASHAEGYETSAYGSYSHAEGYCTTAGGTDSHSEGFGTYAAGLDSHAEGYQTTAYGHYSHAEGNNCYAYNSGSHVEGRYTIANGQDSHTEGYHTYSEGLMSHAEGYYTTVSGNCSHAEGSYTQATHRSQHVFGEYNDLDASTATGNNRGTYVEIVGNGDNNGARSNARTLDWNGNQTIAGNHYDVNGKLAHKPLTEEQYMALSQAEQLDGTEYFVTDRVPLQICDYIYPIGAIYMSVTNVSPAILFGGTWERIKDKFLLAAGQTYNVGASGGEAEHTLIVDEIPAHKHRIREEYGAAANTSYPPNNTYSQIAGNNAGTKSWQSDPIENTGGGLPHNNMPPYLVVNVWMRVPDPVEEEEE